MFHGVPHRRPTARTLGAMAALAAAAVTIATSTGTGAAAGTLPQTVQVGSQTVTVPSSGIITIDGQQLPVLPGVTRVQLVAPPVGSGSNNPSDANATVLPSGAVGESYSVNPDSTAAVVQSTPIYSGGTPAGALSTASAQPQAAAFTPECTLNTPEPSAVDGQALVQATEYTTCNTTGFQVQVKSTLYSWNNGGWVWRNNNTNTGSGYPTEVSARVTAQCPAGSYVTWHARNDTLTVYQGLEEGAYANSNNHDILCQ